jgi:hypothetical protein
MLQSRSAEAHYKDDWKCRLSSCRSTRSAFISCFSRPAARARSSSNWTVTVLELRVGVVAFGVQMPVVVKLREQERFFAKEFHKTTLARVRANLNFISLSWPLTPFIHTHQNQHFHLQQPSHDVVFPIESYTAVRHTMILRSITLHTGRPCPDSRTSSACPPHALRAGDACTP